MEDLKKGDREDVTVVVYTVTDDFEDTETEDVDTKRTQQIQYAEGETAWSRCYRVTAVCVVLLCVLLLTAVTVLWIKFNTLNTEKNQIQTNYNNLTTERDQLQKERDGLQRTLYDSCKWRCFIFSSSFFYMFNEMKSWNESRQDCKDEGADLVIINSKEEHDFIVKQLGINRAWIGLSDGDEEGKWKWVDDTPLTTAYWVQGEPNGGGRENCAEIVSSPHGNYWNDKNCNTEQHWICEKHISQ